MPVKNYSKDMVDPKLRGMIENQNAKISLKRNNEPTEWSKYIDNSTHHTGDTVSKKWKLGNILQLDSSVIMIVVLFLMKPLEVYLSKPYWLFEVKHVKF